MRIQPKHELVAPVMNWLVKNRRGAQWSNTRDTAICVLALGEYLGQSGELGSAVEYELAVNGTRVAAQRLVQPRTAPIEKRHVVARLRHPAAGIFVPARMTLNAVQGHHVTLGRARSRRPMTVLKPVSVGCSKVSDPGFNQGIPLCALAIEEETGFRL